MHKIKPIYCFITNDDEYDAMLQASNLIAQRLSLAAHEIITIEMRYYPVNDIESISIVDASYVIYSLLHFLSLKHFDIELIEKQLKKYFIPITELGAGMPYLLNLFQCLELQTSAEDVAKRNIVIRRIRALNLLALQLSQSHGCGVLDIDSIFTKLGGQKIHTDYTLKGQLAHQIAADFIGTTLLEDYVSIINDVDIISQLIAGGNKGVMQRSSQLLAHDLLNITYN